MYVLLNANPGTVLNGLQSSCLFGRVGFWVGYDGIIVVIVCFTVVSYVAIM